MDLWIRSQDKTCLIKADNLYIHCTCFDMPSIGTYDIYNFNKANENWFGDFLGTYKTKERALEILDEIHQRLINLQCVELTGGDYLTNQMKKSDIDCVYQMPEE